MAGHASGYANNIFDRVGFATRKKLESILMKFVNLVFFSPYSSFVRYLGDILYF